eukprot:TRINITY_DN30980_c0_g1_i1.p1 TRINITY_DN30980_c0_g1~~TRINITY_DN30980_c0_g1_i1.p1  ORF type:complete len:232 (+),score=56.53 TRINITY_DN30980_c0_g1_i1:68-697(+)
MRSCVAILSAWMLTWQVQGKPKGSQPTFRPLVSVQVEEDEYKCARCKWAAKVLRATLGEKKLPRRPQDAAKRRSLAEKALDEASSEKAVCSKRRFPKRIRQRQVAKTMRISFVDENEPEESGGVRYRDIAENMEVAIDGMVTACGQIVPALRDEILSRAYRFTEAVDEFRINAAFTDRWVCHRATGLCPEDEFPERDEDEEEVDDDDEL